MISPTLSLVPEEGTLCLDVSLENLIISAEKCLKYIDRDSIFSGKRFSVGKFCYKIFHPKNGETFVSLFERMSSEGYVCADIGHLLALLLKFPYSHTRRYVSGVDLYSPIVALGGCDTRIQNITCPAFSSIKGYGEYSRQLDAHSLSNDSLSLVKILAVKMQ